MLFLCVRYPTHPPYPPQDQRHWKKSAMFLLLNALQKGRKKNNKKQTTKKPEKSRTVQSLCTFTVSRFPWAAPVVGGAPVVDRALEWAELSTSRAPRTSCGTPWRQCWAAGRSCGWASLDRPSVGRKLACTRGQRHLEGLEWLLWSHYYTFIKHQAVLGGENNLIFNRCAYMNGKRKRDRNGKIDMPDTRLTNVDAVFSQSHQGQEQDVPVQTPGVSTQ